MRNKLDKNVAILSTGDEIVSGEIHDSNAPDMAQTLFQQHIDVGLRLSCGDEQQSLEQSMQFLLEQHQALITIGGLGPTSDDRTRFALANITGEALHFDQATWERIVERISSKNLPLADSNKQQALFPQHAQIIPNENGSASACEFDHQGRTIFMLPGPPAECLPIFHQVVLPSLIDHGFQQPYHRHRWVVTGIGESSLAELLDPLLKQHDFSLHYRCHKPYTDIKICCDDLQHFDTVKTIIAEKIKPYLVN